jgi:hypothetical protein
LCKGKKSKPVLKPVLVGTPEVNGYLLLTRAGRLEVRAGRIVRQAGMESRKHARVKTWED